MHSSIFYYSFQTTQVIMAVKILKIKSHWLLDDIVAGEI